MCLWETEDAATLDNPFFRCGRNPSAHDNGRGSVGHTGAVGGLLLFLPICPLPYCSSPMMMAGHQCYTKRGSLVW